MSPASHDEKECHPEVLRGISDATGARDPSDYLGMTITARPASEGRVAAQVEALARESRRRPVWLRVGQLIDGTSDRPTHDADIVFDATQFHDPGEVTQQRAEPDLFLPHVTALPCLIEAHAHLFLDGGPIDFAQRQAYLKQPAEAMVRRARSRWAKILRCGVGAVRDAGDKHGVGLALAGEARQHRGKLAATPWIDSPGAAIHHSGRYGSFMGQPIEDHATAAACVGARVADGADRIKLLVSGIINFKEGRVTTPPQMPAEEVRAIVEAARARGKQTFAHASGADGVENSIEGGVNTVEHGFFITEEQLARMRDRQIAWTPTFAPVQLQIDRAKELCWSEEIVSNLRRIIESHQKMLRRAHETGVIILAGSDAGSCGVPHGLGLLDEMEQMERAGMPAMSVIRSATGVSAAALEFGEPIGRIAPGHRARFILTSHDPSRSVANLRRERTVVFDGQSIACERDLDTDGL